MASRWVRWLPAIVVPAALAAGAIAIPLAAGAADLPVRTPEDVLRLVASSDTASFSGTVEQSSELGLPSLPGGSSGGDVDSSAASALELLTGNHTAKVYVDGPTRMRVQVLDRLAERDAVRNGTDVWLYDSSEKDVTHITLPSHTASTPIPDATSLTPQVPTPQALAKHALAAVHPSTRVTLGDNSRVAGRDAYELVLTPRTSTTLVGSVRVAVDGVTGLPLRVQVLASGTKEPAFSVGFTTFSDQTPDAGVFAFTPPTGAAVTEQKAPADASASGRAAADHPRPTVIGTGWDAIVSLPPGSVSADATSDAMFQQLTRPVEGGRALSTALLSVLVTADGRVLAGAVPVSALQAAAL